MPICLALYDSEENYFLVFGPSERGNGDVGATLDTNSRTDSGRFLRDIDTSTLFAWGYKRNQLLAATAAAPRFERKDVPPTWVHWTRASESGYELMAPHRTFTLLLLRPGFRDQRPDPTG